MTLIKSWPHQHSFQGPYQGQRYYWYIDRVRSSFLESVVQRIPSIRSLPATKEGYLPPLPVRRGLRRGAPERPRWSYACSCSCSCSWR